MQKNEKTTKGKTMSDPTLTNDPEVDSLDLMEVTWNEYSLPCTAKNIPRLKENNVWFVRTDKMSVGRAVVGTSEGFEPFELVVPYSAGTYRSMLKDQLTKTEADATFIYKGSTPNISIVVPDCVLIGVVPDGSENQGELKMTIKLQAKGGILKTSPDSPIVIGDALEG